MTMSELKAHEQLDANIRSFGEILLIKLPMIYAYNQKIMICDILLSTDQLVYPKSYKVNDPEFESSKTRANI